MSDPSPDSRVGSGWWHAPIALLVLWLLTLYLFRETAWAMLTIWDQRETFAHAWTVPPIALWLAWRQRKRLLTLSPAPSPWMLIPVAFLGLLWLSGEVVAVAPATQFALVSLLVMAVPALLGLQVARVLMFPLGFLFFCVPIGEFLSPTLMHWTAEFTVAALRATGIPVYQEGLNFVIPSGHWSVIEACSGIRYLIASVMVGTLFAYLNYQSLKRRLIFVAISIVVPLVANWLRAYMIVMLGHLSNNTLAVGADHLLYGWVFFGIVIAMLYWIGARWAEPAVDAPPGAVSQASWPAAGGMFVVLCASALMALPHWLWQGIQEGARRDAVTLDLPAELPGGYRREQDPAPRWQPGFRNPSETVRVAYLGPSGERVGVFVGYYRGQGADRKLVSSANRLLRNGDNEWNLLTVSQRRVPEVAGGFSVREGQLLQVERPGALRQRLRVWQTYWIDGVYVANDVEGKLRGAWARLSGRGDDSAVLLLFVEDDEATTDARLSRFLTHALPVLTSSIEAPRRAPPAL
jgi:exosortase A